MDRNVLQQEWEVLSREAFESAYSAVEKTEDGRWIADSEWAVRAACLKFMEKGYQKLMQAKADEHAAAKLAAFSPSGSGVVSAQQGNASAARVDGRRRD
jgi:hypothetical protein